VAEARKAKLARPFRDLLEQRGLRGIIVSDEPSPEGAWTPEEKVNAYLDEAGAAVVFATADVATATDTYTKPNIADEIGRARSKPGLRDRVCVLKEHGVTLPSNINPAYEQLDVDHPEQAFERAFAQLAAWGLPAAGSSRGTRRPAPGTSRSASHPRVTRPSAVDDETLIARAQALIPVPRGMALAGRLAVAMATWPNRVLMRPAQLEDPAFAARITRELLTSRVPLFETSQGTTARLSGNRLEISQAQSVFSVDESGAVLVIRPLHRERQTGLTLLAIVEEDVRADIATALRFMDKALRLMDPHGVVAFVTPAVALVGVGATGWRTRAEQLASPTSMTMNVLSAEGRIAHLTPASIERSALNRDADGFAADLMVLLRRLVRA
jgi:hypothetical protein